MAFLPASVARHVRDVALLPPLPFRPGRLLTEQGQTTSSRRPFDIIELVAAEFAPRLPPHETLTYRVDVEGRIIVKHDELVEGWGKGV